MYAITFADPGAMLERMTPQIVAHNELASYNGMDVAKCKTYGQMTTLVFGERADADLVREKLDTWQVLTSGEIYLD